MCLCFPTRFSPICRSSSVSGPNLQTLIPKTRSLHRNFVILDFRFILLLYIDHAHPSVASTGKVLYKALKANSLLGLTSKCTLDGSRTILSTFSRKYRRENTPSPNRGCKSLRVKTHRAPLIVLNGDKYADFLRNKLPPLLENDPF